MTVRKLVYVVDDDAGFLRAIQRLLKEHGYAVGVFHSVEEFNDHAVLDDAFCLVLDIHLGDRSGIDLSRQLSKRGSSLPIIFITANDSESYSQGNPRARLRGVSAEAFPGKITDRCRRKLGGSVRPDPIAPPAADVAATRPTKDGRAFCLHDAGIHLSYSHLFGVKSTPWHWP